jgi:hypothetical protein
MRHLLTLLSVTLLSICTQAQTHLLISSGTQVKIESSQALGIDIKNGSMTNSGTWTKGNEKIIFSGTSAGELKGVSSTYHHVQVSNTGGITLNTPSLTTLDSLSILSGGIFTLDSTSKLTVGTIANNNGTSGLIIRSKFGGSGSLIHNNAGVNATVQSYLTDSAATPTTYYHMVSPPVSGATAAIFNDYPTSGPYLYYYNYAASPRWVNIVPTSTSLAVGSGYLINFRYLAKDQTLNYRGPINVGEVSPSFTYATDSFFYFTGNPYPCGLNWNDETNWTRTGLRNTYWTWVPKAGAYGAYLLNIGGTNGIDNIIRSGQGFFVKSKSGTLALTIKPGARVHSNGRLKSSFAVPAMVKLHLSNDSNAYSDEVLLWFGKNNTKKSDNGLEAEKTFSMVSSASQIYTTTTDNEKLSISALPDTLSDDSIPLFFLCKKNSGYTIKLTQNTYADSVFLIDLLTQQSTLLNEHEYHFKAVTTDTAARFAIRFEKKASSVITTPSEDNPTSVNISVRNSRLFIESNDGSLINANVFIVDMLGRTEMVENIVNSTTVEINNLSKGFHIVVVTNEKQSYRAKIVLK